MVLNIINNLLEFFISLGHLGVALALMVEVIPSEIVLSYAGFLVANGESSFISVFIAGIIGGTLAQIFLYWLGYYGGRSIVEKYGKYLLINKHHIAIAENWFERYGKGIIFLARFIPIVRHAISIPAGLSKMSLKIFIFYTVLAMIPWTVFFIYLGVKLGENWMNIKEYSSNYIHYIVIVSILFMISYIILKFSKKSKNH